MKEGHRTATAMHPEAAAVERLVAEPQTMPAGAEVVELWVPHGDLGREKDVQRLPRSCIRRHRLRYAAYAASRTRWA